jgi:DNA-binding beta-propeller fold protein YncE
MKCSLVLTLALLGTAFRVDAPAQSTAKQKPGPLPEGGYLLNTGWTIRPAGEQVPLDTLPMSSALSSDGKYLLVLNAGIRPPSVSVVDVANRKETGRTPVPDAWLGLVGAPSNGLFYVGGGSSGKVYELSLSPDGKLTRTREFAVTTSQLPGAPFIGDVALSPDSRVLYAADLYGDSIAQVNLQSGKMVDHWKTGRRPHRILVTPDGAHLLISSWAENTVYEHESGTGILTTKLRVGAHPGDMLWINKPFSPVPNGTTYPARLFVAASGSNSVYSFGVTQDGQFIALDPINVSTSSMHPLGMTPSALAADTEGTRLYIACSDANALAVADISLAPSGLLGFVPTGWYPLAVRSLPDNQLALVNGKGPDQQSGSSAGSVEFLPQPGPADLGALSRTVLDNSPYRDSLIYGRLADAAEANFSASTEHPSPLQHVIYVIKGNQAYTRFAPQVTPNQHKLAQEFVEYDNFYSNAESTAEGQNWAVAAIAPEYTVELWPSVYAGRSKVSNFEGGEPANFPPAGYLWSNALQAGLTVRNYGEWVTNLAGAHPTGQRQVQKVNDPSLAANTDLNFRGADPGYKDVDRAGEFIREWKGFDATGQAPRLSIVRLSNNTAEKGEAPAPALISDNDRAVGLLVDAVSRSKLWASTAIFIVEAASNGRDGYRSSVSLISPYTQHHAADSEMFNQMSVLRTIELILGMRPMTHFDAAAKPMFGSFSRQPATAPVSILVPQS